MAKEITQVAIKKRLKEIEGEFNKLSKCSDPEYLKLMDGAQELKRAWEKRVSGKRDLLYEEQRALESDLKLLKKRNDIEVPEHIQKWFKNFKQGIDWGYGGLKIVWISDDEKWVIITNPGSTAGTGTAMGVGAYYYSQTNHWLSEVSDKYRDYFGNRHAQVEGRLTKEVKQEMIDCIPKIKTGQKIPTLSKLKL